MNKIEKQKQYIENVSKNNDEYHRLITIIKHSTEGHVDIEYNEQKFLPSKVLEAISVLKLQGYEVDYYKATVIKFASIDTMEGIIVTISWDK